MISCSYFVIHKHWPNAILFSFYLFNIAVVILISIFNKFKTDAEFLDPGTNIISFQGGTTYFKLIPQYSTSLLRLLTCYISVFC